MSQARAQALVNALPIAVNDPSGWQPPYAWERSQGDYIPAIYTHPRFANNIPYPQAAMDPPLA
eukprot:3307715-Lingulodinium_polyedra.AAC.1